MPAFFVCNNGIQAGKNGKNAAPVWQLHRKIAVFMTFCKTGQAFCPNF